MKLYKFRPLKNCDDLDKIKDIIENGFFCCDFLNFNDMNEGVFTINSNNRKINLKEKQKYKICSFSGANALNKQLLWGHYANTGMGIVIELEINNAEHDKIKQVRYTNSTENLDTIEHILTRKSEEWKYENEFRYLIKTEDQDGVEIHIGKIIKIYFGTPYKSLKNYEEIKGIHKSLKQYLDLKDKLESFCTGKHIQCEDYKFK